MTVGESASRSRLKGSEPGQRLLQELLTELALALLPRGMTPKRFGKLARAAFVRAAADTSRFRNGKVNRSRVAAQTGLSRAAVTQTLRSDVYARSAISQNPLERVIEGWRNDRQFASKPGCPRLLSVSGPKPSFIRLAAKYAGDVPPKAILDELRRIGAVAGSETKLQLSPRIQHRHDFRFLSPVLPVLVNALRAVSHTDITIRAIHQVRFPARTKDDLSVVRDRCTSSTKSMFHQLGRSLKAPVKFARRKAVDAITITVLITENAPHKNADRVKDSQRLSQERP